MGLIQIIRLAAFGTVIIFSLVVMGLTAHLDAALNEGDIYFVNFALAISVLSQFTIIPIIIIERVCEGAITSLIIVELIWVGLLWVLWLVSGSSSATLGIGEFVCNQDYLSAAVWSVCNQVYAITTFSFLNWVILMGWFSTLLVFGFRGKHWYSSVSRTDITKRNTGIIRDAPVTQNY